MTGASPLTKVVSASRSRESKLPDISPAQTPRSGWLPPQARTSDRPALFPAQTLNSEYMLLSANSSAMRFNSATELPNRPSYPFILDQLFKVRPMVDTRASTGSPVPGIRNKLPGNIMVSCACTEREQSDTLHIVQAGQSAFCMDRSRRKAAGCSS